MNIKVLLEDSKVHGRKILVLDNVTIASLTFIECACASLDHGALGDPWLHFDKPPSFLAQHIKINENLI